LRFLPVQSSYGLRRHAETALRPFGFGL